MLTVWTLVLLSDLKDTVLTVWALVLLSDLKDTVLTVWTLVLLSDLKETVLTVWALVLHSKPKHRHSAHCLGAAPQLSICCTTRHKEIRFCSSLHILVFQNLL
jgi:hypothetical protein